MSRFVRLKVTGEKPSFPKITYNLHLLQYLTELSYGEYQNGTLMPLSYPTIESWKNLCGIDISFGEVKALISLSSSYINVFRESKAKDFKMPFVL